MENAKTIAGAVSIVLCYGLKKLTGLQLPIEVEGAALVLITTLFTALTSEKIDGRDVKKETRAFHRLPPTQQASARIHVGGKS